MRPHVSYSELTEFATVCQHRWKLNYLEERRTKVCSVHFDFGTAVHNSLESYFTRKYPATLDEAVVRFRTKLSELYAEFGPKYEKPVDWKEIEKLSDAGTRIIQALKSTPELQDVEVVYNEHPLFVPIDRLDGIDIKFKGFIDLVIKAKDKRGNSILWVCDYKTCSWGWDGDTRRDRLKHYQVFLYKHFLCKKFDLDPRSVRTAFILLKKRPPKGTHPVEFFPVSAGPVSVQRALDFMNSAITEMAAHEKDGLYEKDRKSCVDSYGNTCPYFRTLLCP